MKRLHELAEWCRLGWERRSGTERGANNAGAATDSSSIFFDEDELRQLISARQLLIEPVLDPRQVEGVGVDLRLDCFFREFVRTSIPFVSPGSETNDSVVREIEPFKDSFFLQPGEFALAQSLEYVALNNRMIALLNGRSSLARRGLAVHATANLVDPGWEGHLTFELANLGAMPIQLVQLMRIARLVPLRTHYVRSYKGQFARQLRIAEPKPDPLVRQLINLRRIASWSR
jgi:dCTP deaminase